MFSPPAASRRRERYALFLGFFPSSVQYSNRPIKSSQVVAGSFLRKGHTTDIKALTEDDDPTLVEKARPAFRRYNEEQLTAVKLPAGGGGGGGGKNVMSLHPSHIYLSIYLGSKRKKQGSNSWGDTQVLISAYNSLGGGRYFDVESGCSFLFDHVSQVCVDRALQARIWRWEAR